MSEQMDYIARQPCGCYTGWISGDCDPKDIAQDVARWIRAGCVVERLPTEHCRELLRSCIHKPKRRKERSLFA